MSSIINQGKRPPEPVPQSEAFLNKVPSTILEKIGICIAQINGWILILLAVAMVSCITWQVISRYFLGSSSTLTDELARFLFMWIGLLGAVQASAYQKHLAIDLLLLHLHGKQKMALTIFIELCILTFAVTVMVYGGGSLTIKTFISQQITPSLRISMGYIYAVVPLAGVLIAFYAVSAICSAFKIPANQE